MSRPSAKKKTQIRGRTGSNLKTRLSMAGKTEHNQCRDATEPREGADTAAAAELLRMRDETRHYAAYFAPSQVRLMRISNHQASARAHTFLTRSNESYP